MVDSYKTVIGLVPTVMAGGLVKHNLNFIKKKKRKSFTNLAVTNIVGTSLISATAQAGNW